jgi:hypothetical protein
LLETLLARLVPTSSAVDPVALATQLATSITTAAAAMAGKGSGTMEMLEIMKFAMDNFGPEKESDTGALLSTIRDIGGPLVSVIGKAVAAQPKPVEVHTKPVAALPPDAPAWVAEVRGMVGQLLPMIQRGMTPAAVASQVQVRAPMFDAWLEGQVQDPTFRAALYKWVPDLSPHMAWVDQFLHEFVPEPEEAEGADPKAEVDEDGE